MVWKSKMSAVNDISAHQFLEPPSGLGPMSGLLLNFDANALQQTWTDSFNINPKQPERLYSSIRRHLAWYVPAVFGGREEDTIRANAISTIPSEDELVRQYLFGPLERFLCNTDAPDEFLRRLKEYDHPPVLCGKVFRLGEPTYSCKDCGMDHTCVLCVTCFEQSAHKKHRYKMSTSSGGGYCDCGDSEAWRTEPFCDTHRQGLRHDGSTSSENSNDPTESLPVELRQRAEAVFKLTIGYAVEMLTWREPRFLPPSLQSDPLDLPNTYCTMLFNDETHSYEQVINALMKAISCDQKTAIDIATIVDREGRTVVKAGNVVDCEAVRKAIEKQTSRQGQVPLKVLLHHTLVAAHQKFSLKLLTWLQDLIRCSEGLRQLFSSVVLESKPDQPSIVETVLLADVRLWKLARVQSRQLLMAAVVMDMDCKRQFAILFTRLYPQLMKQFIADDDHEHSISATSESVQLYTVPSIARMLISDHSLLEVILTTFRDQCRQHTTSVVDRKLSFERHDKTHVFRRATYALIDLKYVLLCPPARDEWTDRLRTSFMSGYRVLLEILGYMQGMDAVVRQMGQHIEFEAEWEGAFNVQIRLSDSLSIIQDWCRSDLMVLADAFAVTMSTVATLTSPAAEAAAAAAESIRAATHEANNVVAVIAGAAAAVVAATVAASATSAAQAVVVQATERAAMAAMTPASAESRLERITVAGRTAACIRYDFSVQPVSVHQPVTRLLAGLCASINMAGLPLRQLQTLHGTAADMSVHLTVRDMIEPSLRTIVLVAQCQAGMWRRNGYSLQNQVFFYQSVKCRSQMYDKDLLMLQIGAALMEPNEFLLVLLHKFGLLNWAREDYDTDITPEDSVKQLITLAEHFFKLIIMIFCERYTEGVGMVTPVDIVKREIVHQLCIQPMSHSELTKSLADDPYKENNIEDVIDLVAVMRVAASGGAAAARRLFELKPECYALYTPYFYHYSRTDQVKSEEAERKRRKLAGEPQVLSCPELPEFIGEFKNIVNLLTCDVLIYVLRLVLLRSTAKWSKSWSEAQLEKVLFIIDVALTEERNDSELKFLARISSTEDGATNIYHLLEGLAARPPKSHHVGGQREFILQIIRKCADLRRRNSDNPHGAAEKEEGDRSATMGVPSSHEAQLELERAKKVELASKRRERVMAKMAKLQRNFIRENRELFESTPTETSSVAATSEHGTSVDEAGAMEVGETWFPVCIGTHRNPAVVQTSRQTCILCQEEQDVTQNGRALVYCAYIQKSTVLAKRRGDGKPTLPSDPLFVSSDLNIGTYVSVCGHVMHSDCWQRFFDALLAKETRRNLRFRVPQTSFDVAKNEFLCPLCETISNTVLPLLPQLSALVREDGSSMAQVVQDTTNRGPSVSVSVDLSLDDWLDGIESTVKQSVQQRRDKENADDADDMSFLFVPCPLSSVTRMMTESVARNFQSLFDYYIYDNDDASAHFSDSVTEMLRKFSTDVFTVGLGLLPDDDDVRVPALVWMVCAYTVAVAETCARGTDPMDLVAVRRPLFGALPSRQSDCINAFIRLAAVVGTVSSAAVVRRHCIALLSALVTPALDGGISGRVCDCPPVISTDMFHVLVCLCLSLPTLYVEESPSSQRRASTYYFATGGLNDSHALHLVYAAHIVQIILLANVTGDAESMATDEPVSADAQKFIRLFIDIRRKAGLSVNTDRLSPNNIMLLIQDMCLPFLRCSALFFHYLTSVPAPLQLFETSDEDYEHLCRYLSLPSSLTTMLTMSRAISHYVDSWCEDAKNVLRSQVNTSDSSVVKWPMTSRPNQLIILPDDYSELMNQTSVFACPRWIGDDSRSPAMCLVCGAIVCSQSYCCQKQLDGVTVGAATAHAFECGAGTGIFLRVRDCQILLLCSGSNKGCFFPPPYLDAYGETDEGLKRGNALHLCAEHYRKLHRLWLSHGTAEEIVHSLESNTGLMGIDWHHL